MSDLDTYWFFVRKMLVLEGGVNLVPYPNFTQPFNAGQWQTGQGGVGWAYDASGKLAVNDGVFNDTQFLYLLWNPAPSSTKKYKLRIQVVAYPNGGGNFGTCTIYALGYSLLLESAPGTYEWELTTNDPPGAIYFLVNGQCRIALELVEIRPM